MKKYWTILTAMYIPSNKSNYSIFSRHLLLIPRRNSYYFLEDFCPINDITTDKKLLCYINYNRRIFHQIIYFEFEGEIATISTKILSFRCYRILSIRICRRTSMVINVYLIQLCNAIYISISKKVNRNYVTTLL